MNETQDNSPETNTGNRSFFYRLRQALRRLNPRGDNNGGLRESLEEVIEEHEEADELEPLSEDEREMLLNVLKYNKLRLGDIMVPRADIVAMDMASPFQKLVKTFSRASHSRIPIFRGSLDEIVGMVHVKDIMAALSGPAKDRKNLSIEKVLRNVIIVPPSMRVIDLLKRMKAERTHMAIVVDEYGGTDGLVTIEDLVEQIVGEIEDEYDEDQQPRLTLIGKGVYEADARLPLEALEETVKCDFVSDDKDETIDTVGGLVVALEGRVPAIGEIVDHDLGFRFEVVEGDARRIKRIRIHLPQKDEG